MGDLFDRIYDATCEYVEDHKTIVGAVFFVIIAIWFGQCCLGSYKPTCTDSVIDMNSVIRECFDGAKLKHVADQWICSCEK